MREKNTKVDPPEQKTLVCPTCGSVMASDDLEGIWYFLGRQYCSERCNRIAASNR